MDRHATSKSNVLRRRDTVLLETSEEQSRRAPVVISDPKLIFIKIFFLYDGSGRAVI